MLFGCMGLDGTSTSFAPSTQSKSGATAAYPGMPVSEVAPMVPSAAPYPDQLVTKISSATVKVPEKTLEARYQGLRSMLGSEGAQVADVQYNEYSDRIQYSITVKVPPTRFESILAKLKDYGEVKDLSVSVEDVTKQYTDLNTRIRNKEIELERLQSLYDASGNISDLLQVERELARVESELELLKGEKQYLESRIAKSTITIRIYEEKPATTSLGVTFDSLAQAFFGAMAGAVMIIAISAGFLLPGIIVILVSWFIWKMVKGKGNSQSSPAKTEPDSGNNKKK